MRYFNESNFLETTKTCFYELIHSIQTIKKKNELNLVVQQTRHPDLPRDQPISLEIIGNKKHSMGVMPRARFVRFFLRPTCIMYTLQS